MEKLPPIPIPLARRWRNFRVQFAPFFVFAALLGTVAYLWTENVAPASIMGEGEVFSVEVNSSQPGALADLRVSRFQMVSQGETIARVITTDPRIVEAQLAVVLAEVELLRVGLDPLSDPQRNLYNQERLKLDWMIQRGELAKARVNLQRAENEYDRMAELRENAQVSQSEYERAETELAVMELEVSEGEKRVEELEAGMTRLRLAGGGNDFSPADSIRAAVSVQETKLGLIEAELSPITLTSPITGMVTGVHRRTGETVTAGESVITISATETDRVIGYLRQPIAMEPHIGMTVHVRTRTKDKREGDGEIISLGPLMEPILPSLLHPGVTQATGLPVLVRVPPEMGIRPGEVVDLTLAP